MHTYSHALLTGKRRVRQLAAALRISEAVAESGERIYTLAVQNNFIRGRKAVYIVSACLYAACRLQKDSHMLIDFSDFLQVSCTIFHYLVI